jgi:RimJ/RimL family protein N-acetyltransferase
MQLRDYNISQINETEVEVFLDHMERQVRENGQGDTPIFSSIEPSTFERKGDELINRWKADVSDPGWTRNWAAWADGRIIGNIQLDGARYPVEKHRIELSMAIESGHRGIGLGSAFMEVALEWAKANRFDWIDLGVFSGNEPAIGLYEKFGFERCGYYKDKSRILGRSVDLISMCKKISVETETKSD